MAKNPQSRLLDLAVIVSIVSMIIGALAQGAISVGAATLALLCLVVLLGLRVRLKMSYASMALTVAMPIASVILFLKYVPETKTPQFATTIATLVIILFGLYIMVRGRR
jgi:hypothetical protein